MNQHGLGSTASDKIGEQKKRRNEWRVIPTLLPFLWEYKLRVAISLGFLIAAKLANVGVPLVMKVIVDDLTPGQQILAVPFSYQWQNN